jgi:transposase InsO family protein
MEAEWMADRIALRTLLREHPDWCLGELAEAVNRSVGWVNKWVKRLRGTARDDHEVVRSQSRARKHPPPRLSAAVVAKILELRDSPPAGFNRVPGPKAILYFLQQDIELKAQERLPRSTRTIWRILRQHQRIFDHRRRVHHPVSRPAPMTSWQLDFKDVTSVAPQPDGKQLHVVEVLNTLDVGTSALIAAQARADFTAETALAAVAATLQQYGLPEQVSIDRDPRWVGSHQQRDFPAALVRFLLCLSVEVIICPPNRPDKNGFVERYHRSYGEECLDVEQPTNLEQVETVTARFQQHYNYERPHQGVSCGNQPPLVAFPSIAPRPPVPALVDPDAWLSALDGRGYLRRVKRDGTLPVDRHDYYISARLARQQVLVRIDAAAREFAVEHAGKVVKRVAIRGVGAGEKLSFEAYVTRMQAEARSERSQRQQLKGQLRLPLE